MPNYPEQSSQSESTKHPDSYYTEKKYTQEQWDNQFKKLVHSVGFGGSLPFVNTISGPALQGRGWERKGSTYTKGENTIVYDGAKWILNGKERIEFIQDIPE